MKSSYKLSHILIFFSTLFVITTITTITIFNSRLFRTKYNKLRAQNIRDLGDKILNDLDNSFKSLNWLYFEISIKSIGNRPDINSIDVIDNNGYVYQSTQKERIGKKRVEIKYFKDSIIIEKKKSIGNYGDWYVVVDASNKDFTISINRFIQFNVLISIIVLILLFLLISFFSNYIGAQFKSIVIFGEKVIDQKILEKESDIKYIKEINDLKSSFMALYDKILKKDELIIADEEKLRLTLKSMKDSILIIDEDMNIIDIYFLEKNIHKLIPNIKIGFSLPEIFPKGLDNRVKISISKLLKTLSSEKIEFYIDHKDHKHWFLLILNLRKINDEKFHGITVVIRDITIMKNLEKNLELAKNEAIASNRAKSEFLANMSHEIRTPINSIIGYSEILLEEEVDQNKYKSLQIIVNSSKHLLSIINDILDFSKIEAGKIVFNNESFNLMRFVKNIRDMLIINNENRNFKFLVKLDASLNINVYGDEHRCKQIFINLLNNAFKFTKKGFVKLDVYYKDQFLYATFEDTGIGIPKNRLQNIFSSFEQADNKISSSYGGTGLGLSICKEFARLMNGSLEVESELGKGTKFYLKLNLFEHKKEIIRDFGQEMVDRWLINNENLDIDFLISDLKTRLNSLKESIDKENLDNANYLIKSYEDYFTKFHMQDFFQPIYRFLKDPNEKTITDYQLLYNRLMDLYYKIPKIYHQNFCSRHRKLKILIVDDIEDNRNLIKLMLKSYDLFLEEANNGVVAIQKLVKSHYDIVLLDMQMPVMDGLTAIKIIRQNHELNHLYVIALTAQAMSNDRDKILEAGCDDYLTKPVNKKILRETIESFMNNNDRCYLFEKDKNGYTN